MVEKKCTSNRVAKVSDGLGCHVDLPVALLSSVACELAPLRTVLFMCFFTYFLLFYFSF